MSLDVTLKIYCSCGEHQREVFDYNITHNLCEMAEKAGIYKALWRPEEIGIEKAEQIIPFLKTGLSRLESNPKKYKKYNPKNGWGSYEGLIKFIDNYLEACNKYPKAIIKVSR